MKARHVSPWATICLSSSRGRGKKEEERTKGKYDEEEESEAKIRELKMDEEKVGEREEEKKNITDGVKKSRAHKKRKMKKTEEGREKVR